ncbi:MAG: type IV toxin-antitoxin system AbiEi family antitoxin domain-containing protein [Waddliaceae bacterium]
MGKYTNEQRLYDIASLQQGYFTARQAKEAGYADSRFSNYVKKGRWTREGRGIYRLANYPIGDRPDLVYWSLWSCNRSGKVQGVFSHQTALAIHDLSDVMPAKYHLSVPTAFRKYHPSPENIVMHFSNLLPEETLENEGYKVTTPEKTIYDVLLDDEISEETIIQAISDGLNKGILSKSRIKALIEPLESDRIDRIMNDIGIK